jgi:hypothetical protein
MLIQVNNRALQFHVSTTPASPWATLLSTISGQIGNLSDEKTRLTVWGEIEALESLSSQAKGPFAADLQQLISDFQALNNDPSNAALISHVQRDFQTLETASPPPLPPNPATYFKQAMYSFVMKIMQDVENPIPGDSAAFFAELQGMVTGMTTFGNLMGSAITADCTYVLQKLNNYAYLKTPDAQLSLIETLYGLASDINQIL